jgi:hypothetical protein
MSSPSGRRELTPKDDVPNNGSMRRRRGLLLPLEESILAAGLELRRGGADEFHGFAVAKQIRDGGPARQLTAHGTLYKALERMERAKLLSSRWEDPLAAAEERRPRRRLYQVTGLGATVLADAQSKRRAVSAVERLAPS